MQGFYQPDSLLLVSKKKKKIVQKKLRLTTGVFFIKTGCLAFHNQFLSQVHDRGIQYNHQEV